MITMSKMDSKISKTTTEVLQKKNLLVKDIAKMSENGASLTLTNLGQWKGL